MLRCSIENVSRDSNFEIPILPSDSEKKSVLGERIISKKEIDIRIFITVRKIVVVQKRFEHH